MKVECFMKVECNIMKCALNRKYMQITVGEGEGKGRSAEHGPIITCDVNHELCKEDRLNT